MRHKRFLVLLAFWLSSILAHPRETHTPITLLPTTSKITSSTPTSAPPPLSVERIEDVDREDPCSSSFFEFTEENIESSEVHSWYVKSREEWKENSPSEFRKYGETGYFARKILGLPNFRCGVEKNGCDEAPSCETVLKQTNKFLQEKNDTKTVQWGQLIFRTRQVYFVVKAWQTIGRRYHTLHHDLEKAQIDLGDQVPQIIHDFTSQKDEQREIENKLKKAIWDMAWKLVEAGITQTFALTPVIRDFNVSPMINVYLELVKTTAELSVAAISEEIKFQQKQKNHDTQNDASYSTPSGQVCLSQSYSRDLWGIYQNDENQNNIAHTGTHVQHLFRSLRKTLLVHVKDLFNGNLTITTETPTPALAALMTAEAQGALRALEEMTTREDNLAEFFQGQYVVGALSGNQCFAECKLETSLEKVAEDCPHPKLNHEKSFCSKEPPYQVCVTKCWKAKSGTNELTDMYGVEHLSDYHTSEEILITDALSEQQQMGLAGDSPSFTGKVLDKVFQLGNTTAKFGDTIPLCVSEYIDLQRKDGFPCQCGSWNSNGTKIFMKKVGLTQHDPDWMSDPTKWTMKNVCPDHLRNRLPAPRFKLFCDLDIGFPRTDRGPQTGDDRWAFRMQKDPLCDEILPNFEGKSDIKASQWFCEKSEMVREELFAMERVSAWYLIQDGTSWKNGKVIPNHSDLCDKYKRTQYAKEHDS